MASASGSRNPTRGSGQSRPGSRKARFSSEMSLALGLRFSTQDHLDNFTKIQDWTILPTRFADPLCLSALMLTEAVTRLFAHIGWADVLDWHKYTFATPTLEFLSTATITSDEQFLQFQAGGESCSIPLDDIARLGSRSDRAYTYGPRILPDIGLVEAEFWREISDDPAVYDPRRAKASLICHPALKVAHRLIVYIFFAREDSGTVSSLELHLLYAMTHGDPYDGTRPKPDLAKWLLFKPLALIHGKRPKIMCGGIVTLILRSDSVPSRLSPAHSNFPAVPGETRLTDDMLSRMHMFITTDTHRIWLRSLDNSPYLSIPIDRNLPGQDIFLLSPDIRDQNWNLPPNIFEQAPVAPRRQRRRPRSPQPIPEQAEEAQYQQPPPDYPSHHSQYMAEFAYFREGYQAMDQRQQRIETSVTSLRTDFEAERARSLERYEAQQAAWDEVLRLQRQMLGMHFQPPPPPPDFQ